MFLTRDALNSRALTDYDICIVGSGPAGLTIARNFLGTKKKVLILESGDGPDFDFTHDLMSGEVESGGSDGKLTYALPSGSGLHLSRYRGFGGTMNIWTGRIRPLDPSDFLRQTSLGGWLLNFDDMRQWYEMALKDFGIPSLDDYRLRPEDSSTVFYPIARQNSSDLSLKSWIRTNRNIGIDLYDAIAVSENIDCITDATANDIVVEGEISNNIVDYISFKDSNGDEFNAKARKYVLACGGIENPRLLLLSRFASDGEKKLAPGAENYWIGRCFMEHFLVPMGNLNFRDAGIFRLNNPYFEDPDTNNTYAIYLGPSEEFIHRTQISNGAIAIGPRTPDVACSSSWRFSHIMAEYEQLPNPDSRITLSASDVDALGSPRVRVEWRMQEEDKTAMLRMAQTVSRSLYSFGARMNLEEQFLPSTPYLRWSGFGSHHMGTTRMSEDASTGVVDKDLRVHGTDNLFIAGSSVFATGGASNPTLTIIALSHRLAFHLKRILQ